MHSTSYSRSVSDAPTPLRAARFCARAAGRSVRDGSTKTFPARTVRRASTRSRVPFSTIPVAPAFRQARSGSGSSKAVWITTADVGETASSVRHSGGARCAPSFRSRITMSGCSRRAWVSALAGSAASPTSCRSTVSARMRRTPSITTGWSSTTRTRAGGVAPLPGSLSVMAASTNICARAGDGAPAGQCSGAGGLARHRHPQGGAAVLVGREFEDAAEVFHPPQQRREAPVVLAAWDRL